MQSSRVVFFFLRKCILTQDKKAQDHAPQGQFNYYKTFQPSITLTLHFFPSTAFTICKATRHKSFLRLCLKSKQHMGSNINRFSTKAARGLVQTRCLILNQFIAFHQPKNQLPVRKTGSKEAQILCWFRTKKCLHQGLGLS